MRTLAGLPLFLALGACGGSSTPSNPGPPPPTNPYTLTITAGAGVNPKELSVPLGSRVLFVNNDSRQRNMASDPHPEHSDCPEINVGFLRSGESRETQNLVTPRTCGFHDHDDPNNNSVKGRIIIRP